MFSVTSRRQEEGRGVREPLTMAKYTPEPLEKGAREPPSPLAFVALRAGLEENRWPHSGWPLIVRPHGLRDCRFLDWEEQQVPDQIHFTFSKVLC